VERVSGPADQPAAFNEMPDRPIGSTRLLQQNRPKAEVAALVHHLISAGGRRVAFVMDGADDF